MPTLDKLEPSKPLIDLPEEDWRRIEAALGLRKPDLFVREGVARSLVDYLQDTEWHRSLSPNPSEVRKWLKKVQTDSNRLAQTLTSLQENADLGGAADKALELLKRDAKALVSNRDAHEAITSVPAISAAAREALKRLPPGKSGPKVDECFYDLILNLGAIYQRRTKKEPGITWNEYRQKYEGRFLRFVEACLDPIEMDLKKSDQGLAKAIQRCHQKAAK